MRYPLVIGNWKLNGNKYMVKELISGLLNKLSNTINCDVAIAPPIIYLDLAKCCLGSNQIALGAQDVDIHFSGAFTGEVSANMLKDIGVKYVIIGHSERRIYHNESNEIIAEKFAVLKKSNLIPVLCIGDNKIKDEAAQTKLACTRQIDVILNDLGAKSFENTVIAYEPIWAIGTGRAANPEKVQATHEFIRAHIAKHDEEIAEQIIIQYGGSVDASNAAELLTQPDIDGVLVGGASLKVDDFSIIIQAATQAKQK